MLDVFNLQLVISFNSINGNNSARVRSVTRVAAPSTRAIKGLKRPRNPHPKDLHRNTYFTKLSRPRRPHRRTNNFNENPFARRISARGRAGTPAARHRGWVGVRRRKSDISCYAHSSASLPRSDPNSRHYASVRTLRGRRRRRRRRRHPVPGISGRQRRMIQRLRRAPVHRDGVLFKSPCSVIPDSFRFSIWVRSGGGRKRVVSRMQHRRVGTISVRVLIGNCSAFPARDKQRGKESELTPRDDSPRPLVILFRCYYRE